MPRVPGLVSGRAGNQMLNSNPKPMFSATALEGTPPQPHKVHLKSLILVSRKDVGTFPLQVNLPPEKGRSLFPAGCPDHRLLRSPSCGPSWGSMETAKTVLQFGKADLLWGGTAVQAVTTSLPQFPHWILVALSPQTWFMWQ